MEQSPQRDVVERCVVADQLQLWRSLVAGPSWGERQKIMGELVEMNTGLCWQVVYATRLAPRHHDDLFHFLRSYLPDIITKYDPSRGEATFAHYAITILRRCVPVFYSQRSTVYVSPQATAKYWKKKEEEEDPDIERALYGMTSLSRKVGDAKNDDVSSLLSDPRSASPEATAMLNEYHTIIAKVLATFPDKEREIACSTIGLTADGQLAGREDSKVVCKKTGVSRKEFLRITKACKLRLQDRLREAGCEPAM